MVKLFMTGDNHFGKTYGRYKEIKDKLIESRFKCLEDMVRKAEKEGCEYFVITGDLFDTINTIRVGDVKRIVGILSGFANEVLVLPGNHDYYTGDEKVWKAFENAMASTSNNITLLKEFKPYSFGSDEDKVIFYPAYCQSKHSKTNNLKWIKDSVMDSSVINIGVAHGAIQGITPDKDQEYFLMTENELNAVPVDAWLIGHTHISYPRDLKEDEDTIGHKVFNAGTHEQIDLHNNTDGEGFILTITKENGKAIVAARKYVSGKVHFEDIDVHVKPVSDTALEDSIKKALDGISMNSVLRLTITGSAKQAEYDNRKKLYNQLLSSYLTYEVTDTALSEEITVDKIRSEYAETSFAAKFLEELIQDPIELQMAYTLLQKCKDE